MKKLLAAALVLSMALAMVACGNKADVKSEGVMTHAEYVAAELDSEVVIETSIVSSIYARHNSVVRLIINEGAYCYITAQANCTIILESKSLLGKVKMSYYSGTIIGEEHFDKINYKQNKE